MKPLSFFAILLLAFSIKGQVKCQVFDEKVLTGEDFQKFRMIEGPQTDEETFWLQISKDLPPYQFRIVPIPEERSSTDFHEHRVGQIEISTGSPLHVVQTIQVDTMADSQMLRHFFQAMDINFDGNLDISVVDDYGAKWGRQKFWLFDKETGLFITNSLTDELHGLSNNGIDLYPETREIKVNHLIFPPGIQSETYKVGNEHLDFVELEETEVINTGTRIYVKRRIDGKLTTVSVRDEPN